MKRRVNATLDDETIEVLAWIAKTLRVGTRSAAIAYAAWYVWRHEQEDRRAAEFGLASKEG